MRTTSLVLRQSLLSLFILMTLLSTQAATNMVRMGNYWYSPTNITINAGDSVLWTNVSTTAHDTTSSSGLWASPTFGGVNTYTYKFNNAGYYPYICGVHIVAHPEQTGTVTVVSSALAPTVSITSPANGEDFSTPAKFTFSATAADSDGTVTNVQFFAGTTLLGSDNTSPFSLAVSNLAAGNYTLTATAMDNTGIRATSGPVRIAVGTSRLVKMGNYWYSPTNITINSGDSVVWTNVSATAHDTTSSSGLWASPTFGGNNTFTFRFTNTGYYPYICGVHIVAHPEQTGTVTVVSIGNISPTVAITTPTNGTVLGAPASFTLSATASDSDGSVSQVEFFQGTGSLGVDASSPYSVAVSGLAAGSYTFSAVATDNLGAKATNSVSIVVNALPTTSITSPTNGQSFIAPANISIAASASDTDGSVAKVEFFNGATKLGEDTTSPYSFSWNSVAVGSYTITVKATDNLSASAVSSAISITVTNNPPTAVTILNSMVTGEALTFSFLTETGRSYTVEFTPALSPTNWQTLTNLTGTGNSAVISDSEVSQGKRFYRVFAQ